MRAPTYTRPSAVRAALLATVASLAAACGDEGKVAPAPPPSASAPSGPVLDGKLGEAAADIAKGQTRPGSSAQAAAADGPPPNNMFTREAAEKAHPSGAPAKLELMGEGNEPRLQLGAARPEGTQEMLLVVAITSGQQQALPPMAVRLLIGDKAKAEPPPKGAPKPAKSAEPVASLPPSATTAVVATITEAAVAGMPSAEVPKQLGEAMAKLKGSTLSWTLGPEGPGAVTHTLAKGADEGLDIALEAVEEAIGSTLIPVPAKAVGEGATWMVTDRSTSMGIDAVRYRFVQLEKVDGDRATLAIQIRKYAASDRLDLPLGPQMSSASLDKIDAQGKVANLVLIPRAWVADSAEISSKLMAQLAPPGGKNPGAQPAPRAQVQLEVVGQMRSPAAVAAATRSAPPEGAPAPGSPAPKRPRAP